MPSKKTSKPEIETVKAAEPVAPAKKKPTQSKTTTPAATHKAPATKSAPRKSTVKAQAPAEVVEVVAVNAVAFDAAQHHEEIAREAYFVYLSRGGAQGSEHDDWMKAIEIVRARYA